MKKALAVVMMIVGAAVWGSPASLVVKAAEKAAGKSVAKAGAKKAGAAAAAHAGGRMLVEVSPALLAAQTERASARAVAKSTGKTLGKVATPKNILAAGGATAAVVAAHEVSDGVQSMGEGVGKAVEENPDLAPKIADSLSSTLKWLVIPIGAVLAALLAWFLWPFVKIVRVAVDLVSAKCARRIGKKTEEESSCGEPAAQEVVPGQTVAAQPGRVNFYMLTMIAGFAVLTIVGIWHMASGESGNGRDVARVLEDFDDDDGRGKMLASEIKRLRADYVAELDRAQDEFNSSVEAVARSRFGQVESMVPSVANRFGTLSRCAGLVKCLAVDKVKGGNSTEASVNEELEKDFYVALYAARDAVGECVKTYAARMENARSRYGLALKGLGATEEFADDARYNAVLAAASQKIEVSKAELRSGQNAAAMSAAVELIFIRQTVSMVAKVLGKIAAREAAAAAAGAGAAAVDGPLPVGDVIGGVFFLGSTAWSGYEVYKATKVLPAELSESMRDAVDSSRRQCLADAKAAGRRLRSAYLVTAR